MTLATRRVGQYGEDVAAQHLREVGYEILARNWRCKEGEIDIIARYGKTIVFVEVKTRRTTAFGSGVEAIDWRKARVIRKVASAWLARRRRGRFIVRFDVISVVPQAKGEASVEHLVEVFL